MASPNETKLSEHQSGDTDHTAPSTPTPGELSAAGTAQEGVQGNSGESPAPVTHASDIETEFHEQSHGEPFLDYSHSPVTDVAASAADQPPQVLTEIAALLSAVDTTSASSKSASDDGKGSNPDDGESETGNDDGSHADDDDSNVSDSDKEDDMDDRLFDPINHTSEDNPDNDTDNGAGPGNMSEENRVGGYQSLQVPNPFEPDHGDGTSIADDPLNYGDFSDEEDDLAEAIRASVADQATPSQAYSAAEASSSHVNSENKASMTGAAAESDIEKVVAASPLGSASSSGANIDTPTTSSTDSEQSTGGTTASTTFPSIYPSHDDVEHSSPTILTPTSSQHSEDGNNEAMTSKSIGCSEQPGSSVEVAPIRSDHDDERHSETAVPTDPEHKLSMTTTQSSLMPLPSQTLHPLAPKAKASSEKPSKTNCQRPPLRQLKQAPATLPTKHRCKTPQPQKQATNPPPQSTSVSNTESKTPSATNPPPASPSPPPSPYQFSNKPSKPPSFTTTGFPTRSPLTPRLK